MKHRKLRKLWAISMTVLMSLALLSGCGKDKNTNESMESETETQPGEKDELNAVSGEVVSLKGNKLKITTYDNENLTFFIEGALMKGEKNIDTGNPVSVVYYGDILDDGDTSEVMVELIIGMDKDTVASFVPGEDFEPSDGEDDEENGTDSSNKAAKMTGIVIDYTEGGKLILENEEDGIYYYFETEGARVKNPEAIVPGEEIVVDYKGDVYGSEVVSASKLTLNSEGSESDAKETKKETDEEDEEDEEETKDKKNGSASVKGESIDGKIKTLTQNTVTIETESGTRYKFSVMDAEIEPENGLKKGMDIKLYYDGDLEEGAENVEVKRVEEA